MTLSTNFLPDHFFELGEPTTTTFQKRRRSLLWETIHASHRRDILFTEVFDV